MRSAGAEVVDHDGWCFLGRAGTQVARRGEQALAHGGRAPVPRGSGWSTGTGPRSCSRGPGYTGERGFELFADAAIATELWDAIVTAGRPFDLEPCGLGARDVLRLEMGYPLYGQDLGPDRTTLEAGLGWAVSFDKGPFVGRDALERQRERGPAEPAPRPRDRRPAPHPAFAPARCSRTVGRSGR